MSMRGPPRNGPGTPGGGGRERRVAEVTGHKPVFIDYADMYPDPEPLEPLPPIPGSIGDKISKFVEHQPVMTSKTDAQSIISPNIVSALKEKLGATSKTIEITSSFEATQKEIAIGRNAAKSGSNIASATASPVTSGSAVPVVGGGAPEQKLKMISVVSARSTKVVSTQMVSPANVPPGSSSRGITCNGKYAAIGWNACKKIALLDMEKPVLPPSKAAEGISEEGKSFRDHDALPVLSARNNSRFTDFSLSLKHSGLIATCDSKALSLVFKVPEGLAVSTQLELELEQARFSSFDAIDFPEGKYRGSSTSISFHPVNSDLLMTSYNNGLVAVWDFEKVSTVTNFKDSFNVNLYSCKYDKTGK
jgi:hypothetical protein